MLVKKRVYVFTNHATALDFNYLMATVLGWRLVRRVPKPLVGEERSGPSPQKSLYLPYWSVRRPVLAIVKGLEPFVVPPRPQKSLER